MRLITNTKQMQQQTKNQNAIVNKNNDRAFEYGVDKRSYKRQSIAKTNFDETKR